MSKKDDKISLVDSTLGKRGVDTEGAAISGVRLDPSMAYADIPVLLQKYIDEDDCSAWDTITGKINYIYENLDYALSGLNRETDFGSKVQSEIKAGKKLFFKPNFVNPLIIDYHTHGEGVGAIINTEWPLIAAVMRWFHDKLNISYYQMAFGEASCVTFVMSAVVTKLEGRTVTTEAVLEGRSDEIYGGGGFYFVRRYLKDQHPVTHNDDPMKGYEDSVGGTFYPPGKSGNRLMVYDLNKLEDKISRARTISVPGGVNFKEITLHKVIIGGDPQDEEDRKNYPGCVLVSIPKLKMHAQDLMTNAVKNLGIGLYPVKKYEIPNTGYPSLRTALPHSPWIFDIDENTRFPIRDQNGNYIMHKTEGMNGTQTDVIKAVQSQKVFMIHITDTINMINYSHNADGRCVRVPEGYIWSSLDCVALDHFCSRYCFKTIPMLQGMKLKSEMNLPTEFIRHVPVAVINGKSICSDVGFDSPLFRYDLYQFAESRGVGQLQYYVTGWDSETDTPMASIEGHLGRVEYGVFSELITKAFYYNYYTILHDIQRSILSYAKACDQLTGSTLYKLYMDTYDENHDGIIDYEEQGRGYETAFLLNQADNFYLSVTQPYGDIMKSFFLPAYLLKYSIKNWNELGHDFLQEGLLSGFTDTAYQLSQSDTIKEDRYFPQMYYGKGMWPSWDTVIYINLTNNIYGSQSPNTINLASMYGSAFQYADKVLNSGGYTTGEKPCDSNSESEPFQYGNQYLPPIEETVCVLDAIKKYMEAIEAGAVPLRFTFYVPNGYGELEGKKIPNVTETDNPAKIFTVHFEEVWL